MSKFKEELENLINKHSKENGSNTPDFLLAEFLIGSLENYNQTVRQREVWLGNVEQFVGVADLQKAKAEKSELSQKIVISDLDGTIALCDHRRPILADKSKNLDDRWRAFFAACVDDQPNLPVILILKSLKAAGHRIVIFSARSNEVYSETIDWLENNEVPRDALFLREAGDFTPDHELKKQWLEKFDLSEILCVFDDRDSVVQMWREHGLNCFQVAPGNF